MTFMIFMMGVTLVLNGAVGFVAWQIVRDGRADRERHERTRCDLAQMLAELQRIRELSKPMRIVPESERRLPDFGIIIGTALASYEGRQAA